MDAFFQDVRFAVRSLRKQRGISTIAIVCLALGIGANTAIFSVVRSVLLDSLPYHEPSRLVRLYETGNVQGTRRAGSVSTPDFIDWRAQNEVFEGMAAYDAGSFDLNGVGGPERIRGVEATANIFGILGSSPIIGRTFAFDDDQKGKPAVAVLGEGFWRRRFGGDRSIVGRTISLNNKAFTVLGIMPAVFDFPIGSVRTDVWMPMIWDGGDTKSRGSHWMSVIARLKPGIDSARANTHMSAIMQRLVHEYPDQLKERGVQVNGLNGVIVGRIRTPLLILLGAVGLVLLIACANVANLLLARAAGRRREVAVRTTLGAERSRLIRQFLTESLLLAMTGGALGLAVAHWGLEAILAYAAASLPRAEAVGLNPGVLAFAAFVSLVTGVVFGIVPALRASQTDLREDLNESTGRTGASRKQHRTLNTLIVAEISLSLVLLVGAGLLMRGFVALIRTDSGITADHVLTFHISHPGGFGADSLRYTQFYGPLLDKLRALPGVRRAATTTILPIQNSGWNGTFTIVGRPREHDAAREPFAEFRTVSDGYFASLGIAMAKGREFSAQDSYTAPHVLIVNDEFVRRYFPNEDPIGKQILPWSNTPATIIGVAHSVRQVSLDQAPRSELYVPAQQAPGRLFDITYIVSTQSPPQSLVPAVRQAVHSVAPDQPIYLMKTMDEVISDSLVGQKLTLSLLGVFALLAVLLSAAGVYGVMSYGVSQRRREIGIRMALGARGTDVTGMIISGAAKLAAIGVAIGLCVAAALTSVLNGLLYGVGAHDPVTFVVVAALIGGVALLASFIPALRASRVDPLVAMRTD